MKGCMTKDLSIAIAQMKSSDQWEENLDQIFSLLQDVRPPTTCVFFPENSIYFRLQENAEVAAFELDHPAFAKLSEWSTLNKICLHLGSVPLLTSKTPRELQSASIFIQPGQKPEHTYSKIHLFDIDLEGQKPIYESKIFKSGKGPGIIKVNDFQLGQTICYDLRFAELFSYYAKHQVDAVLVPAAFLKKTGEAHWEVLVRARAIESQCYIIAAAQAGVRETYGRAMVVDPWGNIVAEATSLQPQILHAVLSRDLIQKVRRQMPVHSHRKMGLLKSLMTFFLN